MLDFLSKNAIYIVMIIVLIVWTGIFFYLLGMDRRIKSIEQELKGEKNEE
ncbi:MAG: CcmD family protein [Ignavibacterium sp.]|nr:CcmD family protein [Ignavibacterium sp.]MCX7610683.1 CcmD family protein [Ignavibacterium sp.]MDW8375513.1 CcmD family protein [Ignavibacteriales bacterium]